MSTLNVSNITDGTDTVETGYVLNGSAKAWINYNGTGTVAIRDSFNVGSLVDTGTGFWTVNYSSNMSDSNNSVTTATNQNSPYPKAVLYVQAIAASNVKLNHAEQGTADYDASYCAAHTTGDLA